MDKESHSLITIETEMQQSYMDYAMSVIVGRALPDARDGLKPVQRRILYAMLGEGLLSNRKHSKCAGVVGEVLKKFHPHGDTSVYDALVRLAQPWSLRYPLVDGQGNFGSIDGDPPAAYRYTESRMAAISARLLDDIDKDTVDFGPNFDDTHEEPIVLPAGFPNLLVNGADGIAVGMATHIPPHNLREVVNGALALLENPSIATMELIEHIPGPDFPTGGTILGRSAILSAYSKGRGIIKLRGEAETETLKRDGKDVEAIVITEIPFQVNKASLVEKIGALINERAIEGISKLRDESDRKGMRIVMELKRDASPEIILNQLYKLTPLQSSFGIINLAIVEGRPVVCSLKQLLQCFLDHRRDVVTRRAVFELRKAEDRMHILEGFRIALINLDRVIQLIRAADTPSVARRELCSEFELSTIQAQAILELRLQKLTGMERLAVEKEHADLAAEIEKIRALLADQKAIDGVIGDELTAIRDEFGDDRRTRIIEDEGEIEMEDLIEDEKMVISVSHQGYIKRTPAAEYKSQKRGGKGVTAVSSKDEDFVEHLFVASTLAHLFIFTSLGRCFVKRVYMMPQGSRTARGRALVNLLDLRPGEKVSAIRATAGVAEDRFIVMATKMGYIKKTDLMSFERANRKSGLTACTLADGDQLIGARITHGDDDIVLASKSGMAIRFHEDNVRPMGRTARGVKGINLEGDDEVVGMVVVAGATARGDAGVDGSDENEDERPSENASLLTACENGYGKRTRLSEYRTQNRGGKGLIDIQTTDRNGPVVSVSAVEDGQEVMAIASSGKIVRMGVDDISLIGRNTKGVRLVNLEEAEKLSAIAPIRESRDSNHESDDSSGENGGE
ncbi:MAG: DNA gyrase subunit A [Bdellovibrionales bacterium]|nr:DNA gyrase subunit A [Bdellovibrionales bacterium]